MPERPSRVAKGEGAFLSELEGELSRGLNCCGGGVVFQLQTLPGETEDEDQGIALASAWNDGFLSDVRGEPAGVATLLAMVFWPCESMT